MAKGNEMADPERIERWPELSRRRVLRGGVLGAAGLAAAALLGCTQDEDAALRSSPSPSPTTTPSSREVSIGRTATGATPTPPAVDSDDATGGLLITGHGLPYPYEFPEPRGLTPKPGGTLSIGSTIDFGTMDPLHVADGGSVTFLNMVYNRLLGVVGGPRKNPWAIELEPELASSWERTPDGVTFTFNLREDVRWQILPPLNGRPFVAEDARFAFERYRWDGVHRAYWANVGSIEAPDYSTLNIHMERVTADFLLPLASRYQPIHAKELVDSGSIESFSVGTGPMIMEDAVQGHHVAFAKEPHYWERDVLLDGVRFEFVPDDDTRLALFREGRFDYAYSLIARYEELDSLLDTNPHAQINLRVVDSGTMPLGLNLSNPKFADERIRRAIALVLDPSLMADRVYDNLAKILPLHPWIFTRDELPYVELGDMGAWFGRHDPDQAKQLLRAAGAEDLSFDSVYHHYGDSTLQIITDMALEQLASVGITMHSRHVDQTDFDEIWLSGNLAEASTSASAPEGFDADHFFYHLVHSESPKNLWRLDDPQVDAWAEAQQVELDPHARRDIHRTMWDYFLDKMFWPPLPSPIGFEVYQPWVRGIRFGGILGTNSSYYDWGDQIAGAWIDDRIPGRQT